MSKSVNRVTRAAAELGLDVEVVRMGASTRTAEDAAAACGCAVGQIVKSLIFRRDDGALVLLLTPGDLQADLALAGEVAGGLLSRADANEVRARTGFAIGGVSPIGHLEAPEVWMDEALFQHDQIWAAAGAPDAVFAVTPTDLQLAAGAKVAVFSG